MKKLIADLFISLDGVVENPHLWHFPYFNDEMGAAVGASLGRADTVLFGRVTYDSFAGALKTAMTGRSQKVVFFAADGELPYEKVVNFMDLVRNNGAENLGIVFDDLRQTAAAP